MQLDLEKKEKEKILYKFHDQTQRETRLIGIVEKLEQEIKNI